MPSEFIIGMMSGTSADGIDAALVEFKSSRRVQVNATRFTPFDSQLRHRICQLAHGNTVSADQTQAKQLDIELADHYAKAAIHLVAMTGIKPESISAIANHGQTIAHRPNAETPESIQLGCPQRIADLTGVPTISQFRQTDMSYGGQGAPLMPAFHQALLKSKSNTAIPDGNVFVLNLGGIANITSVKQDSTETIVGFDTGPANTLMNQWTQIHKGAAFDEAGAWAASGNVLTKLLENWMSDPFFSKPYPKSTGPDYFNLDWLASNSACTLGTLRPEDVQATLLALTVKSVATAIEKISADQGTIFVCGGGTHNSYLMQQIQAALPRHKIESSAVLGVPPDWVEAAGFAWLGYCYRHNINSNLPSVTGASQATVLGEQYLPRKID